MRDEFARLGRPYTLSRYQMRLDWDQVAEVLKEQTMNSAEQWRNELLASIQAQELELWKAWEKSQEGHVKKRIEKTTGEWNGERNLQFAETIDSFGDLRIQETLIKLREQKMALLGMIRTRDVESIGNRQVNIIEALTITNTGPSDLKRCLEMATTIEEVTNEPMSVEQPAA